MAPRGPGGEQAVAGLWRDAHGPDTSAIGHALAAEVEGLLFTTAFNNTSASSCEMTKRQGQSNLVCNHKKLHTNKT